jgi:hypothetical protein
MATILQANEHRADWIAAPGRNANSAAGDICPGEDPGRVTRRIRGALRQVEHADRQAIEKRQCFGGLHHIGAFRVHVAEIDGVARLRAIEATFLGERDAVI